MHNIKLHNLTIYVNCGIMISNPILKGMTSMKKILPIIVFNAVIVFGPTVWFCIANWASYIEFLSGMRDEVLWAVIGAAITIVITQVIKYLGSTKSSNK